MDYLQYCTSRWEICCNFRCFKPYYKWITFNTEWISLLKSIISSVLNLIINGLPSILNIDDLLIRKNLSVLNLIINGLPSIHK